MRFGKKGKLSPRYVGPYQILKRIGKVAYELELPVDLAVVHPVFHISILKKCVDDPTSVVPLEAVAVKDSLSSEDVPVEILDRQVRRLRNKEVTSVKVFWRSQSVEGATWEAERAMKSKKHSRAPTTDRRRTHGPSWRSVVHVSNSPRTQPEIRLSVDPRPDLRSIGQVTDRGSCPWIDAPKAQLQARLTVDYHGPSFDPRSVGQTVG
ncbi:hypothetical protein MTR67_008407 [Solanum verrucosum]|uniref:Tf2-1-like SH3-like domain-containing protein n=1 Tax=Solanum verrucosum TaxID=315347 RepID=A0AAF0TCE7_SOLVR|nr:hypothetical protein MTR67_008407 [Solanum verrucosum]